MIAAFRKFMRRPSPSSIDTEREISRLDVRTVEVMAQIGAADSARGEALLASDDVARSNRNLIASLKEELRDLEAMRPILVKQHGERRAAETEAERDAVYRAGETAAAEMRDLVIDDLAKHIARHYALIRAFEERRSKIALANANLPPGATPIPDPEAVIRDFPALDREVLSERREIVWVRTDRQPNEKIDLASIGGFQDFGNGRGQFLEKTRGVAVSVPCLGRTEIIREVALFETGLAAVLLRDVAMPGFRAYEGGYTPPKWPAPSPDEVIAAVAEAAKDVLPPDRERFVRVERDSEVLTDSLATRGSGGAALRPVNKAEAT